MLSLTVLCCWCMVVCTELRVLFMVWSSAARSVAAGLSFVVPLGPKGGGAGVAAAAAADAVGGAAVTVSVTMAGCWEWRSDCCCD